MHRLPQYQHLAPEWNICYNDEPIWIHHTHPKSIVYIGFILDAVHSMGLDKRTMTCIQNYSVMENSFTALKILCALSVHPSLTPGSHWSFYCLHSLAFYVAFQIGFFHSVICIWVSSLSFQELIAHFFFFFFLRERERKGGRKRGREASMCGCLSCASHWGSGHQTRHMPLTGNQTIDPWLTGWHSIPQSTEPHQPGL